MYICFIYASSWYSCNMSTPEIDGAKELNDSMIYITLATVNDDGQPWNTPVYAVHDEKYNFYWSSWKDAEHSKNIRTNNRIFFVTFDSNRKRGDNHQRGLYVQASANELVNHTDIK